jgi:hypothetical protein
LDQFVYRGLRPALDRDARCTFLVGAGRQPERKPLPMELQLVGGTTRLSGCDQVANVQLQLEALAAVRPRAVEHARERVAGKDPA